MNRAITSSLLGLTLLSTSALAQAVLPQAAGACSQVGTFAANYDSTSPPEGNMLVCDGANWVVLADYNSDQSVVFKGVVSGVTPTAGAHLTTKDYVDGIAGGLWADNTTHASYEGFHIIDAGQTLPATFDDAGVRAFFYVDKEAFRGGEITGANDAWTDANIGTHSFAWGQNAQASGIDSVAMGSGNTASGSNSVAMGSGTTASGDFSVVTGISSTASALGSTATGGFSTASGSYSVAIGRSISASGYGSVAMGQNTVASGANSVVLGRYATASGIEALALGSEVVAGSGTAADGAGDGAMAFGLQTAGQATDPKVTGDRSAVFFMDGGVGNANSTMDITESDTLAIVGGKFMISETEAAGAAAGCIQFNATTDVLEYSDDCSTYTALNTLGGLWTDNTTHASYEGFHILNAGETLPATFDDAGVRAFFYVDKEAFRGGEIADGNDAWADANIGTHSFAWGLNTQASSGFSIAMGSGTTASGGGSVAMGYNSSATDFYSVAIGEGVTSSGDNGSVAMGSYTTASGISSVAMGENTTASGNHSFAMGTTSTATANGAVAFGDSDATGNFSIAMGNDNTANTGYSVAIGAGSTASADESVALGSNKIASGTASFAAGGQGGTASGFSSVSIGQGSIASGSLSTAIGTTNTASGGYSLALGSYTVASGEKSLAVGREVTAGSGTAADGAGDGAMAFGLQTATQATDPKVTGDRSAVFFMDGGVANANSTMDFASSDTLAIVGGTFMLSETEAAGAAAGCIQFNPATDVLEYSDDCSTYTAFGDLGGLWTDNTTHASYEGFHVINAGETLPATFDDNGVRAFFYVDKGALRGGEIIGGNDAWTDANIGSRSFAWGLNSQAGNSSVAMGSNNTASGSSSIAIGASNTASAEGTVAIGDSNNSLVDFAVAIGSENTASNNYAVALGKNNTANQIYSTAIGFENTSSGLASVAMGHTSTASGNHSFAMGSTSTATAAGAVAFGDSDATGTYSIAMGDGATASGNESISLGKSSTASGLYSLSLGHSASATGIEAQVFGSEVIAGSGTAGDGAGDGAMAFGLQTAAQATDPKVTGDRTVAFFSDGGVVNANSTKDAAQADSFIIEGMLVGIGDLAPTVELDVDGDIEYTGTINGVSDRRLKSNIAPLTDKGDMLSLVEKLAGYSFQMNSKIDKYGENAPYDYGVIAQEIEVIFPELVRTSDDAMNTKSVNYVGIIPPLIESIKTLSTQNKKLMADLSALKAMPPYSDNIYVDVPAASDTTCKLGNRAIDETHMYYCVEDNVWKRFIFDGW